jgi:hypothetical protein
MPQDTKYKYTVNIPWKYGDTISNWDEKCIFAIETFGLPGLKYITHLTEDSMDFIFMEEKDAIHFSLVCL